MARRKHTRSLSDRLRERIEEDGRSISALAREAGIDRGALWRFVNRRRNITIESVDLLAPVLKIRLADDEGTAPRTSPAGRTRAMVARLRREVAEVKSQLDRIEKAVTRPPKPTP
jgi:transcriptional regulator with XRE-family HTH domain